MRFFQLVFILIVSVSMFAQQETEIFLMDYNTKDDTFVVDNIKNISQNIGYDSQPSFKGNEGIIYAGTQNNQTEIFYYNSTSGLKLRINKPTEGGEYSPQTIPESSAIAAVRLDPDGLQRLYSYDLDKSGLMSSKEILADYKVAYFAFHDAENIIASVIEEDQLNLIRANLSTGKAQKITTNTGRSIHKVPGSENVSYTSVNKEGIHEVYVIDIGIDNESYYVCDLPIGVQDHCWLSASELLSGSGSKLYKYDLFGNGKWEEIADLSKHNISEINRIAVSPDKSKVALVASPITPLLTPGQIVDAHIEPFNNKELFTFSEAFAKDVVVKRFPADTMYVGRQKLYEGYQSFYERGDAVNVSVKNRIVHKEWVLDLEEVNTNGKLKTQITLYKTKDGKITEMIFLPQQKDNQPEKAAQEQLDGYNARDIEAFVKPYAEDVMAYRYPNSALIKGKEAMRNGYASFFESTPDLHCNLVNRLVSGNIVVDQEAVTMNGNMIKAVAIYEVENDKITKVTFLPN